MYRPQNEPLWLLLSSQGFGQRRRVRRYHHITYTLLPISKRIHYKSANLTCKALTLSQPLYIVDLLHSPSITYATCSFDKNIPYIALMRTTSGRCSLLFATSNIGNDLPSPFRNFFTLIVPC